MNMDGLPYWWATDGRRAFITQPTTRQPWFQTPVSHFPSVVMPVCRVVEEQQKSATIATRDSDEDGYVDDVLVR